MGVCGRGGVERRGVWECAEGEVWERRVYGTRAASVPALVLNYSSPPPSPPPPVSPLSPPSPPAYLLLKLVHMLLLCLHPLLEVRRVRGQVRDLEFVVLLLRPQLVHRRCRLRRGRRTRRGGDHRFAARRRVSGDEPEACVVLHFGEVPWGEGGT